MSAWIYLFIAGLTEIGWAIGLKVSEGWTRFWPSVITLGLIIVSYFFLSLALKSLPLGTAYAVWTGIGAIGTAMAGMMYFHEPRTALRIFCIVLILAGIAGLKVLTPETGTVPPPQDAPEEISK
jgi:quaternary ammonium compound-resistance protein SugE